MPGPNGFWFEEQTVLIGGLICLLHCQFSWKTLITNTLLFFRNLAVSQAYSEKLRKPNKLLFVHNLLHLVHVSTNVE